MTNAAETFLTTQPIDRAAADKLVRWIEYNAGEYLANVARFDGWLAAPLSMATYDLDHGLAKVQIAAQDWAIETVRACCAALAIECR